MTAALKVGLFSISFKRIVEMDVADSETFSAFLAPVMTTSFNCSPETKSTEISWAVELTTRD